MSTSFRKHKIFFLEGLENLFFPVKINSRLQSLDGLRGIAVLCVFLSHLSAHGLNLAPFLNFEGEFGRLGVSLFFVLSSFLLTSQLLKPGTDFSDANLWINYFSKRFLRVYPLYIFVLLVYLCRPVFQFSVSDFLKHLVLIDGRDHFWTIPVEIKFYFILPFVVFLLVKSIGKRLLFALLVYIIILLVYTRLDRSLISTDITKPVGLSPLPYLPTFLLGSLTALVHEKIQNSSIFQKIQAKYLLETFAFICLLASFGTPLYLRYQSSYEIPTAYLYLIYGLFWATFLVCHLHGCGFFQRILRFKALRFVGIISFSLYMWHIAILGYIKAHLYAPASLETSVIIFVSLVVSTSTYLLIERPFFQLKVNPRFFKH